MMSQDRNHPAKPRADPPKDMLEWMGITDTPNWSVARPLGLLFAIIVTLLFVFAIIAAGAVLFRTIANSSGVSLGAGAMITAILGAPFLIWGTIIKHKTLGFQKEGHMTDRISKAVEQLGADKEVSRLMRSVSYKKGDAEYIDYEGVENKHQEKPGRTYGPWEVVKRSEPNIEVRIGGLLSLERISQDSVRFDKGRDHVRVMEILCAYVRENSNARPPQISMRERYEIATGRAPDFPPVSDAQFMELEGIALNADLDDYIGISALKQWARYLPNPRTDIQQAMDILGRRDAVQKAVELETEAGYRLDLRGSNLQRADLSKGFWNGARMQNTRMEGADFWQARMEGAFLNAARMDGAILVGARMDGAFLWQARMEGANLSGARMEGTDLSWAQLQQACLRGAFMNADTSLKSTVLNGAIVQNGNWEEAPLRQEQIHSMFGDTSTILPEHLDRPAFWPKWKLPKFGTNDFLTEYQLWLSNPSTYPPPPPPAD